MSWYTVRRCMYLTYSEEWSTWDFFEFASRKVFRAFQAIVIFCVEKKWSFETVEQLVLTVDERVAFAS